MRVLECASTGNVPLWTVWCLHLPSIIERLRFAPLVLVPCRPINECVVIPPRMSDISLLLPMKQELAIERENPAVDAAANRILGCQSGDAEGSAVLTRCRSWIGARNPGWQEFFLCGG